MLEDEPPGRPLQKQSCIQEERLDILNTFKEEHGALLEVLQAFHEFRNHLNMMVNIMDVLEKLY